MIWSFSERKREGSKKDAWRYKGALYTVYSRDTLWDGECWKIMTMEMLTLSCEVSWHVCLLQAVGSHCEFLHWHVSWCILVRKLALTRIRRWIPMEEIGRMSYCRLRQVILKTSSRAMTESREECLDVA